MRAEIVRYTDRLTVRLVAETPRDGYTLRGLDGTGVRTKIVGHISDGGETVDMIRTEFSVLLSEILPGDCVECSGPLAKDGGCRNQECDRYGPPEGASR